MSNIKTIAQVLPSLNSGGVERGTLEIADIIVKAKYKSIVISNGGRLVKNLEKNGSKHIELNIGTKSPLILLSIPKIISIIKRQHIDLIHARSRLPAWIIYLSLKFIAKNKRPLFVTTIHGYNSVSFYSSIMTKGDSVIVVSESLKKFILKNYGIKEEKLKVIHRGIPKNFSIPKDSKYKKWLLNWRKDFQLSRGVKVLTISGRIARNKGIEIFIDLISRLKKNNINVIGLIVGEAKSKNYLEMIKDKIKKNKLHNEIKLLGFRADIYNIYSVSDIVYAISTSPEAFGRTVIESLKINVPVIGFKHGGVGEQLESIFPDGIVELNNMNELFLRTLLFLEKKPRVKKFNKFTLEEMQDKTLSVYKSLLNKA